jgi:hypothetical protein
LTRKCAGIDVDEAVSGRALGKLACEIGWHFWQWRPQAKRQLELDLLLSLSRRRKQLRPTALHGEVNADWRGDDKDPYPNGL